MKYTKQEQNIINKIEELLPRLAQGRCCSCCAFHWKNVPAKHVEKLLNNTNPDVEYALENFVLLCDKCKAELESVISAATFAQCKYIRAKQAKGTFRGRCIARGIKPIDALMALYKALKEEVLI